MYTVAPETIKFADNSACEFGVGNLTLMKTAAKNACNAFKGVLCPDSKTVILCGKGNNGGDGYEIANILKKEWFDVTVINVFGCEPNSDEAKIVYNDCKNNGVKMLDVDSAQTIINKADVIVDAVFGVGFYGSIEKDGVVGRLLEVCNDSTAFKVAVDVPSGINSADGTATGMCFEADMTVTMAFYKTGMLSYPARQYCGEIICVDVGYPKNLIEIVEKEALVVDDEYVKKVLPKRESNTHKGTYGRLLMCVGSENMTGAAILAANGALRCGVGLVNIARNKETVRILQNHLVEPIFSVIDDTNQVEQIAELSQKATAILIGCGMGQKKCDKDVLFHLIKNAKCSIIIDADGINHLCSNINILREASLCPIITPHPLEFARLIGKSVDEVQANRVNLAKEFAKEYGCIVVLKGAATVIASPDARLCINTTGGPSLSKGGSGDVLSGVISAFVCQGIDSFDSAAVGVYLHGKAGDKCAKELSVYGSLPSDLPMEIARMLP